MRKPVKKYFMPEAGPCSIMHMRSWISKGASPESIARWITSEYAKASDDTIRRHLGLMLCAAYDSGRNGDTEVIARKCADLFGLDLKKGHTVSESALAEAIKIKGIENFKWLDSLSPAYESRCCSPQKSCLGSQNQLTDVLTARDCDNMFPICLDQLIYVLRGIDGHLWIVAFCERDDEILVDEEVIGFEPALYFTEHDHFTSPVWLVNSVTRILSYILEVTGYPPMQIHKRVIFTGQNMRLINYETYRYDKAWEDVDIIEVNRKPKFPIVPASRSLVSHCRDSSDEILELDRKLIVCLSVLSDMLETYDISEIARLGGKIIEKWYNELCSMK